MQWTLTLHIIYTLLYALAKLLANYLQKVEVTPTNVDHFKWLMRFNISVYRYFIKWCCVHLCRVSVDILCCFEVILRYSPCFCTSSFVNPCIASCIVGIHFPFKVAAGAFMQTPPQSQVISLVSQSTVGAVISDQTSPTANAASAWNCNALKVH